jgi:hypothetical protein
MPSHVGGILSPETLVFSSSGTLFENALHSQAEFSSGVLRNLENARRSQTWLFQEKVESLKNS